MGRQPDPVAEHGSLFVEAGDDLAPTPLARGPWDPGALHGSPVAAVLARALERTDPGPADTLVRLTVDLWRPVPLAPLTVVARTTRPGRAVQWLEAEVLADGEPVAHASGLRMRPGDVDPGPEALPVLAALPGPAAATGIEEVGEGWGVGFWSANEIRPVRGSFLTPGPAATWFRLRCPVVAGEDPTPFQRVAAAADFGSGVGNPVGMGVVTAINADLSIHLHRPAQGEWIGLDAAAWAWPHGTGTADTVLHDATGPLGRGVQSLLVRSMSR